MDENSRLEEINSRNEVVTTDARTAVQSAILINGGAVVALLAFMGSQSDKLKPAVDSAGMRHALLTFVVGVAFSGFCTATAYLANFSSLLQAQAIYEQKAAKANRSLRSGVAFHWISVSLFAASMLTFVVSTIIAARAIA